MSYSVDSVFKEIHSVADLGEGPGRPAPPPPLILGQKVYILVKIKAKTKLGISTKFKLKKNNAINTILVLIAVLFLAFPDRPCTRFYLDKSSKFNPNCPKRSP